MGIIETQQMEHETWQRQNFGEAATAANSFLGMVEELGEMAHAMLKHAQEIRGMGAKHALLEKVIDAHCDLIIFSYGVANDLGYDLEGELEKTWARVKNRNWVDDPERGGE